MSQPSIKSLQKYQNTTAANAATTQCQARPPINIVQSGCKKKRSYDEKLSSDALATYQKMLNAPPAMKSCVKRAKRILEDVRRFDSYREALPYARAASELNKLGDKDDDRVTQFHRERMCLTLLPVVCADKYPGLFAAVPF